MELPPTTIMAVPVVDPFAGAIVAGRYELGCVAASGGFGTVYRGVDRITGVEVAIKVVHRHLLRHAGIRERFRREAALLDRLSSAAMWRSMPTASSTTAVSTS